MPTNRTSQGDAERLGQLLDLIEQKLLLDGTLKPSVTDYLRVLELYRGSDGNQPKEVRVQWVDPEASSSAT